MARDLDLTCLGYAGQCHLDPFVARLIRELPSPDLLTLKLGINIWGASSLTERSLRPAIHGFLDTVRDGHPSAPIVVLSPIACPMAEESPGPVVRDSTTGEIHHPSGPPKSNRDQGALTLAEIREELERAVERRCSAGDDHIHFVDGRHLLGPNEAHMLRDGIHPTPDGYELMADRFADVVLPVLDQGAS